MEERSRPAGMAALALVNIGIGAALALLFTFDVLSGLVNLALLAFVILFIGFGLATWVGMPWVWYVLTFGGGFFGWYYARNDVKEFFGIEDNHNDVSEYSGD